VAELVTELGERLAELTKLTKPEHYLQEGFTRPGCGSDPEVSFEAVVVFSQT